MASSVDKASGSSSSQSVKDDGGKSKSESPSEKAEQASKEAEKADSDAKDARKRAEGLHLVDQHVHVAVAPLEAAVREQ